MAFLLANKPVLWRNWLRSPVTILFSAVVCNSNGWNNSGFLLSTEGKDMKSIARMISGAVFGLVFLSVTAEPGRTADDVPFPDVPRITKENLKPILGNPNVIILDVRLLDQWKEAELKIPGAIYEDPGEVDSWLEKYPKDKTLVFY
jgi:hypothetical protein